MAMTIIYDTIQNREVRNYYVRQTNKAIKFLNEKMHGRNKREAKKYNAMTQGAIYAVFDSSSAALVSLTDSAQKAYNIALNMDVEGFEVAYINLIDSVFDYGVYFYRGNYSEDNARDAEGCLLQEVKASVIAEIEKLGLTA